MLPPNPFNPGTPVDPNDFVGRTHYLEEFRQKLRQTANGSLACMSVVGGYGIGKTSFLHKCKVISEEEGALTIYFSLNEMSDLNMQTLSSMLIKRIKEKVQEEILLQRISANIWDLIKKIKITSESGISISIQDSDEPQYPNLQSALSKIWKILKENKKLIVFLIDEARVLEKNRAELVLYLRAVLEHLQIGNIPVMIVPAGKLSITGPSGTGFSPIVRTFPPAYMENFSQKETSQFIDKKLKKINIKISEELINLVHQKTEGHPFVVTAYMHSAYSKLSEGETELKEAHFKAADIDFVNRVLSPFFSRFYDYVSPRSKELLHVMAKTQSGAISSSELSLKTNIPANELSPTLGKLVQEGAIVRINRGKYKLFHHLLEEYIKMKDSNKI